MRIFPLSLLLVLPCIAEGGIAIAEGGFNKTVPGSRPKHDKPLSAKKGTGGIASATCTSTVEALCDDCFYDELASNTGDDFVPTDDFVPIDDFGGVDDFGGLDDFWGGDDFFSNFVVLEPALSQTDICTFKLSEKCYLCDFNYDSQNCDEKAYYYCDACFSGFGSAGVIPFPGTASCNAVAFKCYNCYFKFNRGFSFVNCGTGVNTLSKCTAAFPTYSYPGKGKDSLSLSIYYDKCQYCFGK